MGKSLGPNRCNRGSILPLVAVSAPLLLGGAGFAIDVAVWYRGNQRLQMAADAAALESSKLLTNTSATQANFNAVADSAAKAVVSRSGGTLAPSVVVVGQNRTNVAVTLTSAAPRYFTRYFTSSAITLSASATVGPAGSSGSTGGGSGGGNCVLALSSNLKQAISVGGSGGITANNCGVFSNSSDSQSIYVAAYNYSSPNSNPAISATGSGTVGAVGGVSYKPASSDMISPHAVPECPFGRGRPLCGPERTCERSLPVPCGGLQRLPLGNTEYATRHLLRGPDYRQRHPDLLQTRRV